MNPIEIFKRQPLLFGSAIAITDTDVDALAHRYAASMALREFDQAGRDEPFLYRASTVQIGDLTVSTGFHTPIRLSTQESSIATVMLIQSGSVRLRADGRAIHLDQPQDLLYLPGCAFEEETEHVRGVLFSLDADRLARTAAGMTGFRVSPGKLRQRLTNPHRLQPHTGVEREVLQTLQHTFPLLDAPGLQLEGTLPLLAIDDLIYRSIALALCGDVIRSGPAHHAPRGSAKGVIIDELVDWIRANLDRPISLSDLEQRSAYSERTLRNAFQQRFGCGPSEWIREQRLTAARERLLDPRPGDSVSTIAQALGYRHLSQFSRDCHRAFGVRPSDLLRQSRQGTGKG